ncbi:hypothetical protein [Hydrogenimonas sp.]
MALYYLRDGEIVERERDGEAVVLSPSLYWYRHARFPTRSAAKAKRLADSLMDSRPAAYTEIYVQKNGDGFDCYAYDPEALARRLEEAGLTGKPLYFLQQFAAHTPLRIDEKRIAETVAGVCVELPDEARALPSLASLEIESAAEPFGGVKEKGFSRALAAGLVGLLAVTMLADLGVRFQKVAAVEKAIEGVSASRSIYEIRAMTQRYEKMAQSQRKLRLEVKKALQKRLSELSCTPEGGCRGR